MKTPHELDFPCEKSICPFPKEPNSRLKAITSYVKRKHPIGREFRNSNI